MQIAGKLYVVAAPSGAGKTSLVKALVEKSANLSVAVSHTTRPQRPYEKEPVIYHQGGADRSPGGIPYGIRCISYLWCSQIH